MPRERKSAPPPHSHPDLVKVLVEELNKKGVSSTPEVPTIYEEAQSHGDRLHVTVIWNRWAGIPEEERGAMILDAYEQAGLEDEMRRITLVLGLTPEEAEDLRIEY